MCLTIYIYIHIYIYIRGITFITTMGHPETLGQDGRTRRVDEAVETQSDAPSTRLSRTLAGKLARTAEGLVRCD